eukprot:8783300-Alexandrium_andersonii.AAC.1
MPLGAAAYDGVVVHCGDSGSCTFEESGNATPLAGRVAANVYEDAVAQGFPAGCRLRKPGKCGAAWWGWVEALEDHACNRQAVVLYDPGTDAR